jgi:hypothetical protein
MQDAEAVVPVDPAAVCAAVCDGGFVAARATHLWCDCQVAGAAEWPGLVLQIITVPEPGPVGLLVGLAALVALGRRKPCTG